MRDSDPPALRASLEDIRRHIDAIEGFDFTKTDPWETWSRNVAHFNSIRTYARVGLYLIGHTHRDVPTPMLDNLQKMLGRPAEFVRVYGAGAWAVMRAELDEIRKRIPTGDKWPKELP